MTTVESVKKRAESDAKNRGYFLNPDPNVLRTLLEGLRQNEERYGYPTCPCRLASGKLEFDRDIVCPCDYRDPDVLEYGYCYCTLYVRKDMSEGDTAMSPIPERRPLKKQTRVYDFAAGTLTGEKPSDTATQVVKEASGIKLRLWYCKQCGYVVFREDPPYICPICRAKREMFAEIRLYTDVQGG